MVEPEYTRYQIPDFSDKAIEKMTPREAEGKWYLLWGLCCGNHLDDEWWGEDKKFGHVVVKLLEKVGKPYDVKTMIFIDGDNDE